MASKQALSEKCSMTLGKLHNLKKSFIEIKYHQLYVFKMYNLISFD